MEQKSFKVTAPGSMMIMGEHAVLDRKNAIVAAVDFTVRIKITPIAKKNIVIIEPNRGELFIKLEELTTLVPVAPFEYVIAAILQFKDQIKTGFSLSIHSDFSDQVGLGSSAAITAATIAAVSKLLYTKPLSNQALYQYGRKAIHMVSPRSSCADLAASIFGGLILFKSEPFKVEKLPPLPDLTAVYCGYKYKTEDVISIVDAARTEQPKVYDSIFRAVETCVNQAQIAIKNKDWPSLGQLFMHHQGLQAAMGVSNHLLDTLIDELCNCEDILGAKISGSGLGDCVIGLGSIPHQTFPRNVAQAEANIIQIPIQVAKLGIAYEMQDEISPIKA